MAKPKNTIKQVQLKFMAETGSAGGYDDVDLVFNMQRLANIHVVSGRGTTESAMVTLVLHRFGLPNYQPRVAEEPTEAPAEGNGDNNDWGFKGVGFRVKGAPVLGYFEGSQL